jgi:hypothetical protein
LIYYRDKEVRQRLRRQASLSNRPSAHNEFRVADQFHVALRRNLASLKSTSARQRLKLSAHSMRLSLIAAVLWTSVALGAETLPVKPEKNRIGLTIVDSETRKPIPARVHLKNFASQAVRVDQLPYWRDHFVCTGEARLELPPGTYSYEVERGPEYLLASGSFKVAPRSDNRLTVELERFVDMATEGWWSGELHVHRPVKDIELLMAAEDLHVAPVITWWNDRNLWTNTPLPAMPLVQFDRNRFYHVMGGEDEREGGALLFFGLSQPLAIVGSQREYPSPMKFVEEARRRPSVWIDIEKPFWWDVPVWLASGAVDSIGLANNHLCRDQMYENEAWGKPRDAVRLPPPRGNGFWTQEIYYHILNCGLRIPPSAGSASGVLPNPVGYNRVYVYLGRRLSYEKWWEGLRAGRSFVSNGPLLRCEANGKFPGHVFTASEGKEVKLKLKARLDARDPISSIEIVKDGRVESAVAFDEWKKTGSLGALRFDRSGWFLVRAIADNAKTFRFASTAPYFVEIGKEKRRISKASAQFFLDWARERAKRVRLEERAKREEVLRYHVMAEKFWLGVLAQANAE